MGGGLGDEMGDMSDGDIRERFGRIEGRLGSLELRADGAEDWIDESRRFHQRMASFVDTMTARETERDKIQLERHRENVAKLDSIVAKTSVRSLTWTVAGVLVAVASLIAAVVFSVIGWRLAHAETIPLHLTRQMPALTATQDAIIPPLAK